MGIADRIYELVKGLPDPEASKVLQYAESVKARSVAVVPAQRHVNLVLFRQYRGRYDGLKIDRDALYDRVGLRWHQRGRLRVCQGRGKVAVAEGILEKQPTISVQVVSEFLNVCRIKLGMDVPTRHKLAGELITGCNVVALDPRVVEKAMQVDAQAQISYWDALIVAAALLSGCDSSTPRTWSADARSMANWPWSIRLWCREEISLLIP
jgi:predicted nucleic acid-binding protein